MTAEFDPSSFPDAQRILLPDFAYLRSVRDQTLPARKVALQDARGHYKEAAGSGDGDWRDLALLGLVGEALQILEDVAYLGTAYEAPSGWDAPRYVSATIYSKFKPTTFYQGIKKWSPDRVLALVGLRFLADGAYISLRDVFDSLEALDEPTVKAVQDAEQATARLLHRHLLRLADAWDQFGGYFNAFKHGALSLNREDYFIVDDQDREVDIVPSISVWRRRTEEGEVHADMNLNPEEVANRLALHGHLALEIAEYVVDARLVLFEKIDFDDQGNIARVRPGGIPWRFWMNRSDVSADTIRRLEAIGIQFSRPDSETSKLGGGAQ